MLFIALHGSAQSQSNKLPPFKMITGNGTVFAASQLPYNKPILLIYFDPSCDHCQHLTTKLVANEGSLKATSIAMITYVSVSEVKKFVYKYRLQKLENYYVGTEGNTFFLRDYFKLIKMPFVALYDKEGNFTRSWYQPADLKQIVSAIKKQR
ncbi:MAG: hypothetical protein IT252_05760 [Chitinophagaceae bacterium]|nr:hypothetical protein [Chitinophagaceae bacterium]